MKKLIFLILLAVSFSVQTIFGCSLAVKPLGSFDETEYVFIGEVVGYTEPVESAKLQRQAFGLIVKVRESVHLPAPTKTHFEVFPIELWADCSESGTDVKKLQKKFPVNSEVRVIAKRAELLPALTDGNIRLEDRPGAIGSIALNYEKTRMTSADSVFDYKSYEFDMDEDSDSKYLLPDFEARKDLLRLKNSKNQTETNVLLARLLYFPAGHHLDIYEIFKKHSENQNAYEHLYCKRLLEIEGLSDDEFNFLKPKLPKVCSQYKNKG